MDQERITCFISFLVAADQDRQNVGCDMDQNYLETIWHSDGIIVYVFRKR